MAETLHEQHPWAACPKCNSKSIFEMILYACSRMYCRACNHVWNDDSQGF